MKWDHRSIDTSLLVCFIVAMVICMYWLLSWLREYISILITSLDNACSFECLLPWLQNFTVLIVKILGQLHVSKLCS